MKGLIDENAVVQYKGQEIGENLQASANDAEYVSNIVSVKMLKLVVLNNKIKQNQVAGSLSIIILPNWILRNMVYKKPDDEPYFSENCLVIAFREGGMSGDKLQTVKYL